MIATITIKINKLIANIPIEADFNLSSSLLFGFVFLSSQAIVPNVYTAVKSNIAIKKLIIVPPLVVDTLSQRYYCQHLSFVHCIP